MNTTLRASELLAVQWSDIDFEKGVIKDIKNLVAGTDTISSAKSKSSNRTVVLNDEAIKALKEWKIVQFNQSTSRGIKRPHAVAWNVSENRYHRVNKQREEFRKLSKIGGFPYLDGLIVYATHMLVTGWLAVEI